MTNFKKFLLVILVGAAALIAEFGSGQPTVAFWLIVIVGGLTTISMFIGMIETLRSGKYGVDILAITAIIATLAVGEYWASLMVLVMLTGGDSLEDYASKQAGRELSALLDNSPQIAHVLEGETIQDLPVDDVAVGALILVKPGEVVPVDGRVSAGTSFVDEASLTGESKPVDKQVGDELMSGSVNGDAPLRVTVTKKAADSQYQTLVKLVKESQTKPARFVRLADRYAVPFTAIAYLIGGVAWFISKDPVRFAEVLVVASPCPLILAAPIALVAGMSRSSRNGIVVKTGTTIEKLADAKSIAFDKTGTITAGSLSVNEVYSLTTHFSEEQLLQLSASAEQESNHILARSLTKEAKRRAIALLPVTGLEEITGQGITATVANHQLKIGKAAFAGCSESHQKDQTAVYIAVDGVASGQITFEDVLRPEAPATVDALRQAGVQHIKMLTGDHRSIAEEIAQKVGITEVHAECLPADKIRIVQETSPDQRPLIMVGDGVNDAPALAVADVGIAMGAHGSTAASESADAVILKDDLSQVAAAVTVAQDTMKIARQSVLIGIFICILLMLIAATGVIPALLGAALQEVVDTVSILSALRAKNDRAGTEKFLA